METKKDSLRKREIGCMKIIGGKFSAVGNVCTTSLPSIGSHGLKSFNKKVDTALRCNKSQDVLQDNDFVILYLKLLESDCLLLLVIAFNL